VGEPRARPPASGPGVGALGRNLTVVSASNRAGVTVWDTGCSSPRRRRRHVPIRARWLGALSHGPGRGKITGDGLTPMRRLALALLSVAIAALVGCSPLPNPNPS